MPCGRRRNAAATSSTLKSVYSIFVSRVDVYTEQHVPQLSPAAQGLVGIVNAKRIWQMNQLFWTDKKLPLKQEMIFASTGTKKPATTRPGNTSKPLPGPTSRPIRRRPTTTSKRAAGPSRRQIEQMPSAEILAEIEKLVDVQEDGRHADARRHQEIRRSAEGAAGLDRGKRKVWARRDCETCRFIVSPSQNDKSDAN